MYFGDETRLGKTKMIQAFLEDSEEEVISFADFNTDIILFDESEYEKFELEENVNL